MNSGLMVAVNWPAVSFTGASSANGRPGSAGGDSVSCPGEVLGKVAGLAGGVGPLTSI